MAKKKHKKSLPQACPCGSGHTYPDCCLPCHQGQAAADPESLMRSRYSAFVLQLENYLLASWYPSTRPTDLDLQNSPKWARLDVISSHEEGNQGWVHFRAWYRSSQGMQLMEEESEFIKEGSHWFYLKGEKPA
ncbi:YchJ family protein [Marinospirillum sp.]|uniref:YchJ family protein n=1 Tax=Marinospirillum sp. TaxID=2183934 RepID=UPI00384FB611